MVMLKDRVCWETLTEPTQTCKKKVGINFGKLTNFFPILLKKINFEWNKKENLTLWISFWAIYRPATQKTLPKLVDYDDEKLFTKARIVPTQPSRK